MPLRILGISGSLRRDSHNTALLRNARELLPNDVQLEIFDGLKAIPPYDADDDDPEHPLPEIAAFKRAIDEADGLLIATPEYNHSIPGVLTNAIDWLSRETAGDVLGGKPVAVVGASSGPWGTRLAQAALRQVLYATGSPVLAAPALYFRDARKLFDDSGRLTDEPARDRLAAVLVAFARWIDLAAARDRAPTPS